MDIVGYTASIIVYRNYMNETVVTIIVEICINAMPY